MSTREELVRELVTLRESLKLPALTTIDALKQDQLEKAVANLRKKASEEGVLPQSLAPRTEPAGKPHEPTAGTAKPSTPAASEFRPLGAAAREPQPSQAPTDARKPGFHVAPRKGITSLRGVLGAGAEVTSADFEGGEKSLRELLRVGLVIES